MDKSVKTMEERVLEYYEFEATSDERHDFFCRVLDRLHSARIKKSNELREIAEKFCSKPDHH